MSALAVRRSALVLTSPVLALSACQLFRPADLIEADPDVTTITVLLEAGDAQARLLAVHPHRPQDAEAPRIMAVLEGPGWTAAFSAEPELESCTKWPNQFVANWPGPATCLTASLPEAVRASRSYGIRGTAPLGSFTGDMTMPAPPVIEDPADALQLVAGANHSVAIPLEFRKGSDIGTLMAYADYFEIQEDGTEIEISGQYPQLLDGDASDTLHHYLGRLDERLELRLLGIGWHYTNFVAEFSEFPLPQPWPDFGIEGDGVYGYFDGLTPSSTVEVRIARLGSDRTIGSLPPVDPP